MTQFLRDEASDSEEVLTPLMLDGTYLSRNFATLGPFLTLQPPCNFPGMSVHSLPVVSVTHFQKREGVTHYLQEMKTSHVGALCLGVAVLFIFNIMVFALRFIVRRQHKNR